MSAALSPRRALLSLALLALLLSAALVAGASFGASGATPLGWLAGGASAEARTILFEVRLPRVLLAALVGGGLALAGAALQALLRNPLAEPFVLGISGGASVGGALAVAFGLGQGLLGAWAVPAAAFAGALAAFALVERLATRGGRIDLYALLLTGAIANAFAAALLYLIQSLASAEQLHAIVFHLMGRLSSLSYAALVGLALATALASLPLVARARDYNALALGEEGARQLGVGVERLKRQTFVATSLLTGLAVAAAGVIGFVGLIVPHLLRLAWGADHRLLLPASALGGATLLVLADLVARTAIAPNELPVGVLTALLGGPFFLLLLRRRGRERRDG